MAMGQTLGARSGDQFAQELTEEYAWTNALIRQLGQEPQ